MQMNILSRGIGRRKEATAQVELVQGSGQFIINGLPGTLYLQQNPRSVLAVDSPLSLVKKEHLEDLNKLESLDIIVKVQGGGLIGQADAIKLAVARALYQIKEEYRKSLKSDGFLTQDSRIKERRKYGLRKARKAAQYHKR